MLKILLCGLLFLTSGCFRKHAEESFEAVYDYEKVFNVASECDKGTLVTFDVDDTLITSRDVAARHFAYPTMFKLRALLNYPELFRRSHWEWAFSIVFEQAERFVFDEAVVNLINKFKGNGCNVLGLTAMETGSFGVIESMPKWRFEMLKDFGIKFSRTFEDVSFTTLPSYRGNHPELYKGILCANQQPKGKVLGAFLDNSNLKPKKIISFDDSRKSLQSIADECSKRNIPFVGYKVRGANKFAGKWSSDRTFLQLDYIMQHSNWISDEEADKQFSLQVK